MSASLTGLSIGIRKWEKLKNVPDLSDGLYDRLKISCERIFDLSKRFPNYGPFPEPCFYKLNELGMQ